MTGIEMIAAERKRQIEEEGWTPEHDAEHTGCELAFVAAAYARESAYAGNEYRPRIPEDFPRSWALSWWKPGSAIHMLVKAGALIAAEIDRRIASGEKP